MHCQKEEPQTTRCLSRAASSCPPSSPLISELLWLDSVGRTPADEPSRHFVRSTRFQQFCSSRANRSANRTLRMFVCPPTATHRRRPLGVPGHPSFGRPPGPVPLLLLPLIASGHIRIPARVRYIEAFLGWSQWMKLSAPANFLVSRREATTRQSWSGRVGLGATKLEETCVANASECRGSASGLPLLGAPKRGVSRLWRACQRQTEAGLVALLSQKCYQRLAEQDGPVGASVVPPVPGGSDALGFWTRPGSRRPYSPGNPAKRSVANLSSSVPQERARP